MQQLRFWGINPMLHWLTLAAYSILGVSNMPYHSVSIKCHDKPLCGNVTYYDPARTFVEKFKPVNHGKSYVWGGYAIIPGMAGAEDLRDGEAIWLEFHNCTDYKYTCAYGSRRVFAIPKTIFHEKDSYISGGSVFTVTQCIKSWQQGCAVALIQSDCQAVKHNDGCEPAKDHSRTSRSGPVLYFIYNRAHGVTAYGSAMHYATNRDEALNIATQYILYGNEGILSNR